MMRLKSKLLSLNANKKDKVKVYSPRNCEELRIPFKSDKVAKVVGKLASIPPPTPLSSPDSPPETQLVTGVLVQNDFKLSLMAPEDLREYAGLTTTTIICKQRVTLTAAGIDLIRWGLESTFGAIDELPEMRNRPVNGNGTTNGEAGAAAEEDDVDEEINKLVAAYLVMGCVTVRYYSNCQVELEWEGNMPNDGIADAVMAVLFSVESTPAAVKRKLLATRTPTSEPLKANVSVLSLLQAHQASTCTRTRRPCPSRSATSTPTSRRRSASSASACSSRRSLVPTTSRPSPHPGSPCSPRKQGLRLPTTRGMPRWTIPKRTRQRPPAGCRPAARRNSAAYTRSASPFPACWSRWTGRRPRCGSRIWKSSVRTGFSRTGSGLWWNVPSR